MYRTFLKSEVFLRTVLISSLLVILLIGGFTYKHITSLTDSQKLVVQNYDVNLQLKLIISQLREAENLHKNYILTKDSVYIQSYLKAREKVNKQLKDLNELVTTNDQQSQNLEAFNELIIKLYAHFSEINTFIETNATTSEPFKTLYFEEKIIMDSIRKQADTIYDLENEELITQHAKQENYLKFTPLFFYVVLLVTLVVIILAYFKISNDLKLITKKNDQLLISKESSNQSEIIGKHGSWIWYVDTDTFHYSDNLYRLLGEEPQSFEATLDNYLKFVHPEDVERLSDGLNQMVKTEELPFITYRIIAKDGTIKHLKTYAQSFYGLDGQKRLLGNTSDVTKEFENLLILEERNLELERNNEELTAFNYAASHDLQEPLRKIQTFISRLQDKEASKMSASGDQYFEGIKSAAARMRLLIDDLIQFSKTNKDSEAFVDCDLNELFQNSAEDLAQIIEDKKAKITADTLPKATVIAFQIQQLFLNLLGNSLKYSKEKVPPIINVSYSKVKSSDEPNLRRAVKGTYHKITVSDNGIGFEQKYSKKIFELFTRLHNKQDYSGTGIGLSICKKIVENHRGYIFSKGEINVGAVFTVYLPVK